MQQQLWLVSSSRGRQRLLREAGIPFQILAHASDEDLDPTGLSPAELVCQIAKGKLDSIPLPLEQSPAQNIFVLAADTLVFTPDGQHYAKPVNKAHANEMLNRFAKEPISVVTGCCLQLFTQTSGSWQLQAERIFSVEAKLLYELPAAHRERYFALSPNFLTASGGAHVEEAGAQFVKWINGSYTTIQGLPMFELRQQLEGLGFDFYTEPTND